MKNGIIITFAILFLFTFTNPDREDLKGFWKNRLVGKYNTMVSDEGAIIKIAGNIIKDFSIDKLIDSYDNSTIRYNLVFFSCYKVQFSDGPNYIVGALGNFIVLY